MTPKQTLIFDTECYPNYWLLAFKNVTSGKITTFEIYEDTKFDADKLRKILASYRVIGFNSIGYDMPMIFVALQTQDTKILKKANDLIILHKYKPWQIEDHFKFKIPKRIDHIDLIEVAPGEASLKIYGGRMHAKTVWELPYSPDETVTPEMRENIIKYNVNDLDTTELLYTTLLPQLELREKMSVEYKEDLCSKSDAQIAEAVINSRLKDITGARPEKNKVEAGTAYKYKKPEFISFDTELMLEVERALTSAEYVVDGAGKVVMPKDLNKQTIKFGNSEYRLGIGGLHSCEESVSHQTDDEWLVVDRDVRSFYPEIIMTCGIYPKHMGKDFLSVYHTLVRQRVNAKIKCSELQNKITAIKKQIAGIENGK